MTTGFDVVGPQPPPAPPKEMAQVAPYPIVLEQLVQATSYRRNWRFSLEDLDRDQGSKGLTLIIRVTCDDSYNQDRQRTVLHYMPVPPAAYRKRDWRRWLFDQIVLVETHEACEFFEVDGKKPFAPNHGDGRNPYTVVQVGTVKDVETRAGTR
jgi:hypothetical protein